MKKELNTSVAFQEKGHLIGQLVDSGYAFAVWRMPNTSEIHFIISLGEAVQKQQSLRELDKGFVLNLYNDNHPSKPFHIPADIQITAERVQIDPRINDSEIGTFIEKINNKKPNKVISNHPRKEHEKGSFEEKVSRAINEMSNGEFEKVVLSRFQDISLDNNFSAWDLFEKTNKAYPGAFCSLSKTPL